MYAVIETGGKQYRVESGDVLDVELQPTTESTKSSKAKGGEETVKFERVLLVGGGDGAAKIGAPLVAGAAVAASVVGPVRADKVKTFKTKKRKGHRKHGAHRQNLLRVRIGEISL